MIMEPIVPDEPTGEVRCPNCGKILPLRKNDTGLWSTMRGFDAYLITVVPTMVACFLLMAYFLGCERATIKWNLGTAIAIVLVPLIILLLVLIGSYLHDEKKRRKELGYQVWMVSCECGNCFRAVRSTTMLPIERMEEDALNAEYEQEE